jgi:hypothetical protein
MIKLNWANLLSNKKNLIKAQGKIDTFCIEEEKNGPTEEETKKLSK